MQGVLAGVTREDWQVAIAKLVERRGAGRKPPSPGSLFGVPSGRLLPPRVRGECACCGRRNGPALPVELHDELLDGRPYTGGGGGTPVDAGWLEAYARVARLREEAELRQAWVKLLERARGARGLEGLRKLVDEWGPGFEHALTAGGGEFFVPIGRKGDKTIKEQGGTGAVHAAKVILVRASRQVLEWSDAVADAGDALDGVDAEVIELFADASEYQSGKRDRESEPITKLRTGLPQPKRPPGRPELAGTRDEAEAELLLMALFPGCTTGQVWQWCRKSRANREGYGRAAVAVYQLLLVDRSVTPNALAAVLDLKKTAIYDLRNEGKRLSGLAAAA